MSCTDSKNNFSEPQIIKIDSSETVNISGKPCIDFQPDDRWQIKDDNSSDQVSVSLVEINSSDEHKSQKLCNSKSNDHNTVNGDVIDKKATKDSLNESSGKIEACEISESRLKRKTELDTNSDCALQNKKMKVDSSDASICSQNGNSKSVKDTDDSNEKISMPSLSPADAELDDKSVTEKNNSGSSKAVLEFDNIVHENKSNTKVHEVSCSEALPKLEEFKNNSENVKIQNSQDLPKDKNDAEIEIISINDKKCDSGDESDLEVQIIPSNKEIKRQLMSVKPGSASALSAGFPYYNSLKEKISNFKAGEYKPVKFPHTGTLLLEENEIIIESPSLLVPLLIKEADEFPKIEEEQKKINGEDTDSNLKNISKRNFFQSSVGQFLINLGMSRVQEWYHRDMKRSKFKQLKSVGKDEELEKTISNHEKRYDELKQINSAFSFRLHRCRICDFKSESQIVMEGHYLIPHLSPRREYRCNFCSFMTKDPEVIVHHFDKTHGKRALLDNYLQFHECIFCSFQSHLKNKVNAHMNRCRKHFIASQNLAPPYDFEFPGVTTKPVTLNDVIGHRRLMMSSSKNTRLPDDTNMYARKKLASVLTRLSNPSAYGDIKNPNLMEQLMASQNQMTALSGSKLQLPPGLVITRPRGQLQPVRAPIGRFPGPRVMPNVRGAQPRRGPPYTTSITTAANQLASSGISITPVTRPNTGPSRASPLPGTKNVTLTPISTATNRNVSQKPGPPQPVALFSNMAGSSNMMGQPPVRMPNTMQMRPVRPAAPYQRLNTPPSQVVKGSSGNTFVVCEICDSYIKDLEELRTHMNWVHKVKIHPKMLVSRPPLNCQKCHWRFFTDQGLERHLLGAHGLVTTNMQEMANKNQDGGRCIICGAVFTYKLVSHMTQVHRVTLKPAHLSYKCTVCTATFTLYRLFESHVYNVHSGSAKRSAEESSEPAAKKQAVGPRRCRDCSFVTQNMEDHIIKKHMKNSAVKVCRIEKCEKCLYSSDELLVIRMSDFGLDDLDESGDDSSEESASEEEIIPETDKKAGENNEVDSNSKDESKEQATS